MKFGEKIDIDGFSIEDIDISEIEKISGWLPENGVVDLNIAEQGFPLSLPVQNLCQEMIVKVDRFIGAKETEKQKAWSVAALTKSAAAGNKTAKDKEWFAGQDDDFIIASNELCKAKACKKWFENKASQFLAWHYALKTYLKRDYDLERLGNSQVSSFDSSFEPPSESPRLGRKAGSFDVDFGEPEWSE